MNQILTVEPPTAPSPPQHHHHHNNNNENNKKFELMLRESITHFIAEYERGSSDFSHFTSIFSRLIQTMTDPPLELTWFYSAVAFHTYPSKKSPTAAKELFQLLISCSTPCNNGLKRVALLAPVVYQLYYIALDWLNMVSCLKREIEGLVEGIVSFISIYCSKSTFEWQNSVSDKLMDGFVDLLRVWTIDRREVGGELRVFFPLVNSEVRDVVKCGGVDDLSGIVMVEVFFLRLFLKLDSNGSREELQKDMHNCAVQTIQGFQNCCFLDMLLTMLLEPRFLINIFVSRDAEILLREALFDAVMLEEYYFIGSQIFARLSGEHFIKFAIKWLLVADCAIQFARESCDQAKAMFYVDAFSKSCIPTRLVKWVIDQAGPRDEICRPNICTPRALVRWLLLLEDEGFRLSGHYISKLHDIAGIHESNYDTEQSKPACKNPVGSIFICFEDNLREQTKAGMDDEMVDLCDDRLIPGNRIEHQNEAERRRKRNEGNTVESESPYKLAKFNHDENSRREVEIGSMI